MCITEYNEVKTLADEREEGREDGRQEQAIATAKRMIAGGKLTLEEIAGYVALPLSLVQQLAGLKTA